MLEIKDLFVESEKKRILNGVSLSINPGEIHVMMGPNGSGKSSLALAIMGHPSYQIISGKIVLDRTDITALSSDKRAKLGLFLAMQYPVAVPGVSVTNLLRSSLKNLGKNMLVEEFADVLKRKLASLGIEESFARRSVNDGFSGGEKKKMEILQLSILQPKYVLLDEPDSGLDIDALKQVASSIKDVSGPNIGVLLITHYQRILKFIQPDFVHILAGGKIVKSGGHDLAEEIENKGYSFL